MRYNAADGANCSESEEDYMKLKVGEMIKRLRKEREITQEEFAEVLGVSCQSVSRWEKGGSFS